MTINQVTTQRPPPPIPQRAPAVPKRSCAPQQPPAVPPPPRRSSPQPPTAPRAPPPTPPPPPPPARHLPPADKNSHLYTMFPGKPPARTAQTQPRKQPIHEDQNNHDQVMNTDQEHPPSQQKPLYKKMQNSQKDVNKNKVVNVPPPLNTSQAVNQNANNVAKVSLRQDSSVSSDSFSQTSSPSYTTKTMEAPLLPHHNTKTGRLSSRLMAAPPVPPPADDVGGNSPLTKSASTPASLQTIVRFHNGSNMSLHHKVIIAIHF